jgi:hypothetical protein
LFKTFLFGNHFSYYYVIFHVLSQRLWFFQTLIGAWLKKSLKQTNFEPPRLETKHLFLSSKIEDLFSPPQTPKIVHCTRNLKPKEYPEHLLPPFTYAFVIEHILPKLPLDPSMIWWLC